MLRNLFNGFCMALADSVPGVSGGSIAFILGFYDRFISSLDDLIYGKKEKKKEALKYLIKLGIGWIIGMVLAVFVLSKLFEKHIYAVSSLFLGFVLFSIPIIIKEELKTLKEKKLGIIGLLIGIAIVVLITYLNPSSNSTFSTDLTNLNFGLSLYIILAGMLAVSAMVLPGISGSTILLIFGLYIPVISSIKELLTFNFSVLPIVLLFALGIILGVLLTIKGVKYSLEKHRGITIYVVIGLMIGSLYAIVMGPTTLDTPLKMLNFSTFNILTFIIGVLIVVALEITKRVLNKNNNRLNA